MVLLPLFLAGIACPLDGSFFSAAEIPVWICAALAGLCAISALGFAVAVVHRKTNSKDNTWIMAAAQTATLLLLRLRYRFQVSGLENVPLTGGVILAANHTAYLDVLLLPVICRRPVRYLSWAEYEKRPLTRFVMRLFGTIPVSSTHAKDAIRTAGARLAAGECIAIFPEGQITRNGALGTFQGGCALIAQRSGVPVVPVYIDGLWRSFFSFSGKGAFKKWPRFKRPQLAVRFGVPLPPEEVDTLRDRIQILGAELYATRPAFRSHLGTEIVNSLVRHPGRVLVVDRSGPSRVPFRGATLLALARWCAREWQRTVPEKRIGILLPPGVGATVANIACVMCGKVPVNLNFTLGRAQLEACIATTGLKTFVTAQALRDKLNEKVSDFPWAAMERIIDIADLLKNAPKPRLALSIAAAWALPAVLLRALWRVPSRGGNTEAAILCTSGSSGQPKGVPLTHANILGNCTQFDDLDIIPSDSIMLGNLPIFHSFGITVTLWFTLTRGICTVNTPSPLEFSRNIAAIREEKVTILISTPTFFRGYLKKAAPADLVSLQLVVGGGEKTPAGFAEEWESRLSGLYREGYGATEVSPVVGVNILDKHDPNVRGGVFVGHRRGSIGRMVCGLAARFTNPMTGERASAEAGGVLWLKGVNVFPGYLNGPALNKEILTEDGWYCTRDIARMDADGFLFIEGRQARFSKIGGEMVPHETVEEAVRRALDMHFGDYDSQRIAVAARTDDTKGECLVLLTTIPIDTDKLRTALIEDGFSNLWIPRIVKRIDAIPVLATGKLDLQRLRQIAETGDDGKNCNG
jgi:acyl-[acyl-carrier-protein]-phospholipid O-acyltransferase/long-chain-fatty-acid--[acyl-carrier-protein] ligase